MFDIFENSKNVLVFVLVLEHKVFVLDDKVLATTLVSLKCMSLQAVIFNTVPSCDRQKETKISSSNAKVQF